MDPLENNHKQRRWLITAITVVALALVALFFLRRGKDDGGEKYRTEAVDRGNVTMTVSATGTVSAVTTVQVGSQVSGIISKLYADYNSQVKKGELLAELDPTSFQQQAEQRQADVAKSLVEVANSKITYDRQQRLFAAGLVPQSDVDTAKAAYDAARAQADLSRASLRQAQTNLGYTKIYSPIDGQVVARQYDIGQTVAASFQAPTLFTIAKDLTKMQVQADVDQSDIGQVRVDEPAHFTVDAYPEQDFRGRISQVRLNATVNQNVITYPVIIEVPNPDGKLRPSMTANVTIEVAEVANVLRVPNAALRFRPPEAKEEAAAPRNNETTGTTGGGTIGATGETGGTGAAGGTGATGGTRWNRRWGGAGNGNRGGEPGQEAGTGQAARRSETAEAPSFERGAAGAAGIGQRAEPGQGLGGLAGAFPGGTGRTGRRQTQTVYVVGEKSALRPVRIRTGLTDGHYTQVIQVVEGTLNLGDKVATGLATAKVEQSGSSFPGSPGGMRGGRPPGRM